MSIDITLSGVNVDAQSTVQAPKLPAWDVPSRMAFHIVYDVKNGPKRPAIRRPYKDTSRPANPRRDFQLHETRQVLDDLMPAGCAYGIVTFEAGGSKVQRKEMRKTAEWLTLRTRSWEDRESGQRKYRTEVVVLEVSLLSPAITSNGASEPTHYDTGSDHAPQEFSGQQEIALDEVPY
jgi:hypothetical protein